MSWVSERLGASVSSGSVELAIRRNPRRAHLLVSRLLGKHVPVPVSVVHEAGRALGRLVPEGVTVIGFAETATALGHAVAAENGGHYLHTTRRPVPAGHVTVRFAEEHSHAVEHAVSLPDPAVLGTRVVLVDDEISTGRSARNALRALRALGVEGTVASLLDTRGAADWIALERAEVFVPQGFSDGAAVVAAAVPVPRPMGLRADVERLEVPPLRAAHGWTRDDDARALQLAKEVADRLAVARDGRTLVLGDEEHLWFPQLVAAALGPDVRTSSTTRSPAVAIDEPGYPLRTAIAFPSTADPGRTSFAYNVAPSAHDEPGHAPGFDHVVLVTDEPGRHDQLVAQIAAAAGVSAHLVGPC